MNRGVFLRTETSVVLAAILIVLIFAIGTRGLWFSNLPGVLSLTAAVGTIAIGQSILMISGEVDLSVGAVFAIAGVILISLMDAGFGVLPAMLFSLLACCAIGSVNALFTVILRVPSMIVTLGAMFILRGLAFVATRGNSISIPRELKSDLVIVILKTKFLGISSSFYILLLLAALFTAVLARAQFGSHLQAVGGNPTAALANGISPRAVKTKAFIISSALAGFSGLITVAQVGSVYSTSGVRTEMETIAAAVMGGCSLRGGIGSVWGAILGVFILASLKGGLMMMGAPSSWYVAFVGAILIGFLVASSFLTKRFLVNS